MNDPNEITRNYSDGSLWKRVEQALAQAGLDQGTPDIKDLAALDQFHTGGLGATREMADLARPKPGMRILDVGSGLGGVARLLAAEHACRVSGIDLTDEFCQVANRFSQMTGLDHLTDFRVADATALPFEAGSFDQAWTMQVQMNIADKRTFYGEIFRVLRPGGAFIFQDIMAGPGGEIHLPVPWADRPEISHLIGMEELRVLLEKTGFKVSHLADCSEDALIMRKKTGAVDWANPPPLALHLVMGLGTCVKMANQTRNLSEGRVVYVRGVLTKPE